MNNKQKTKNGTRWSFSFSSYPLALLISRVFDPAWLIPLMIAGAVGWSVMNGLRWRFLVLLTAVDGLIPFLYFVRLLRTKEISDWDTTKRTERFRLYGFTIIVHALGILLALLFGKIILAKILFSFWILAVVFFGTTLRWKISIHTGVSSAAVTFFLFLFGMQWMWMFLVVFLIGWARVAMKKHTVAQATVGAVVAAALLLACFQLFRIDAREARMPSQVDIFFDP